MAITDVLAPHIPYLRRYARALAGTQVLGDFYVRATLNALLTGQSELAGYLSPRIALFRLFHEIWARSELIRAADGLALKDGPRLSSLIAAGRPALLLVAMEGFSISEAGHVLQEPPEDVERGIEDAQAEIERELASRVLIIEDEPLIALELEHLVTELAHKVVGRAATREEAVAVAQREQLGLILADINLGAGGSGLDAVTDILRSFSVPVVFVTAYPEHLLTGERPEPTYLVTKPFLPVTLQATIGQALFHHALRRESTADRSQRAPQAGNIGAVATA
ncbi:MAG TPA: response regulator [Micropepsaceae bacterium]|nr:response regulator [Micropepsaceae bacterium]